VEPPAPLDAGAAGPYSTGRAPLAELPRTAAPPGSPLVFLWAVAAFAVAGPVLWQPWARTYLRDELGLGMASFGLYMTIIVAPGVLSPLWAYLSDRVPLLQTRREGYLVLAGLLAAIAWVAAAFVPRSYGTLTAIGVTLTLAAVVTSAAISGALAEIGWRTASTGRLSAANFAVAALAGLAGESLQDFVFPRSFGWTAGTGAAILFTTALLALLASERIEQAQDVGSIAGPPPVAPLGRWLRSRAFWIPVLVMACSAIPRGIHGSLPFFERHVLHLPEDAGNLPGLAAWITGIAATVVYWVVCRRLPLRRLLPLAIVVEAGALLLLNLADRGMQAYILARAATGFGDMFGDCGRLDLMLRVAPRGREAFGVTLLMGVGVILTVPFAPLAAMVVGDAFNFGIGLLIAAALTALAAPAVRAIPHELTGSRDGGTASGA
jgi:BT1 family